MYHCSPNSSRPSCLSSDLKCYDSFAVQKLQLMKQWFFVLFIFAAPQRQSWISNIRSIWKRSHQILSIPEGEQEKVQFDGWGYRPVKLMWSDNDKLFCQWWQNRVQSWYNTIHSAGQHWKRYKKTGLNSQKTLHILNSFYRVIQILI